MTTPVAETTPATETVETRKIACDGNAGADGHPRVWLSIPEGRDWIECPYCDTRFVLAGGAAAH